MSILEIYCITDKRIRFLENFKYKLAAVGKKTLPEDYVKCDNGDNIFQKEAFYSELTFQYWLWKNKLDIKSDKWIGFCQKRRFWINKNFEKEKISLNNLKDALLVNPQEEWDGYESIICEPINLKLKKTKILKKGFFHFIKNPAILFDENQQTIRLHFDLHHGNGNLLKAIDLLEKSDQSDFYNYVTNKSIFNPHIMFIAKPNIHNQWFGALFPWLQRCEKTFGFKNLKGYETGRLYAYLAERYLSFWFKKYTKALSWPWRFLEINE